MTGAHDLTAVKAMLLDALRSSYDDHDATFELTEAHLSIELPYDMALFDADKLATTVMEWFATRDLATQSPLDSDPLDWSIAVAGGTPSWVYGDNQKSRIAELEAELAEQANSYRLVCLASEVMANESGETVEELAMRHSKVINAPKPSDDPRDPNYRCLACKAAHAAGKVMLHACRAKYHATRCILRKPSDDPEAGA